MVSDARTNQALPGVREKDRPCGNEVSPVLNVLSCEVRNAKREHRVPPQAFLHYGGDIWEVAAVRVLGQSSGTHYGIKLGLCLSLYFWIERQGEEERLQAGEGRIGTSYKTSNSMSSDQKALCTL